MSRLATSGFLEFAFDIFMLSMLFGGFMALIAWIAKRNQKANESDEVNALMREYLEKKLREEKEKDNN